MTCMTIRPANPEDASEIQNLVERAYGLYIARIGRRPQPMDDDYITKTGTDTIFVADDAGKLTGVIVLVAMANYLLVENIAVDPDRQRTGIGRTLLAHAEQHARGLGLDEIRLYTNAAMTENVSFYPRLGYQEYDRRSQDDFNRVFFRKHLG